MGTQGRACRESAAPGGSCCRQLGGRGRQQSIMGELQTRLLAPSSRPLTLSESPLLQPQYPGQPWAATSKPWPVAALGVRGHGGSVQGSHRPRLPGAPPALGAGALKQGQRVRASREGRERLRGRQKPTAQGQVEQAEPGEEAAEAGKAAASADTRRAARTRRLRQAHFHECNRVAPPPPLPGLLREGRRRQRRRRRQLRSAPRLRSLPAEAKPEGCAPHGGS